MSLATASAASTPTTKRHSEKKWLFPGTEDDAAAAALATALHVHKAAARLLWNRGYRDALSAERFLNPRLEDLHDPFLLKDMDRAVERIRAAIEGREKIEIHGDYDVDGVTSTVVLKKALEMAGASDVGWHIPHRLHEGYGLQPAAIDEAAARGVRLIVSVDNGIRAEAAVRRALELGIDVIVTDHHLPETELPPALAIVNPSRLDCAYPNKNLCGAGVAFKLAHAVLKGALCPAPRLYKILESLLKLVAIATVADIVPLTGENRLIVRHGLNGLGDARNAGLRALLTATGFEGKVPTATEVGFRIAPAINASGRMESAGQAVQMFLTADAEEARQIATELVELNKERQTAERAIVDEILARCLAQPVTDEEAALVFWGEGWHRGVVGIVASRVMQRYHRPAIVLGVENGVAQGSGRSIEQFHLLDALESMRDLFTKFGGHAHAAGMTLPSGALEALRERLQRYASLRLTPEDMKPVVEVDAVLDLTDVDEDLWDALQRIAPFGMDNPRPLFAVRGVELTGAPQLWKEKHLKVMVKQGRRTSLLKGFGMGERADEFQSGDTVDAAFEIERDHYFGGLGLILRECRAVTGDVPARES
jgi:single-stranded-DNA-specific exonuclease